MHTAAFALRKAVAGERRNFFQCNHSTKPDQSHMSVHPPASQKTNRKQISLGKQGQLERKLQNRDDKK